MIEQLFRDKNGNLAVFVVDGLQAHRKDADMSMGGRGWTENDFPSFRLSREELLPDVFYAADLNS